MTAGIVLGILVFLVLIIFITGIRIVRPTQRALVERLGKYNRFCNAGFKWIIPIVDQMIKVNITEQMVDAQKQEIITSDNLNASVDAQVYFKIRDEEKSVKASQYNVNRYRYQIVNLARTTLRNIIGTLSLKEANSERDRINQDLMTVLEKETQNWGISVVRTELKEIEPPKDVQDTMNKVVKAENEKVAAKDYATAEETKADGFRRAEIKKAEGQRQAKILNAQGDAQAIEEVAKATALKYKLENDALVKHFKGNAKDYEKLQTAKKSLAKGSKYIVDTKKNITAVVSEVAGVTPIK